MKTILVIILLSIGIYSNCQDKPIFIEIKDTIEIAYNEKLGNWVQKGDYFLQEIIYDSIGLDSVRIFRFYYLEIKKNTMLFISDMG